MYMKIICAWCSCSLGFKKCQRASFSNGEEPISHGICPECNEKVLAEIHSINLEEINLNN